MLSFVEAARLEPQEPAWADLAAQGQAGLVIPASFEEAYYRDVNLPEQLARLFRPIQPTRIDEDQLEGLCIQAQVLVRQNVLLDDAVQKLYRALANAGLTDGTVEVHRLGEAESETAKQVKPPGTAVLHALKRLWARDWSFEMVLERLDQAGQISLEARPTIVIRG